MSVIFPLHTDIVWEPTPDYVERSHLKAFMDQYGLDSYQDLMNRSTSDVTWFTQSVLEYLDIQFQKPYSKVVDLSQGIQRPVWCVDGKLNIVHNCLDKWAADPKTSDRVALIWEGEEGHTSSLKYADLAREVNRCANALRELGFGKGDAIGLYMPMIPEIVISLMAIAKIGAVILPLFSGYGPGAIATRLHDVGATGLITCDGVLRRGAIVPMKQTADKAIDEVPHIKHVIVCNRVNNATPMQKGRDHWWNDLVSRQSDDAEIEPTEAEDVLMILYTSGTTGRPKGAVHTHCGFPVKAAQDMAFGMDVHAGEVTYWMTDMGWMMGPWLVMGTALLGGTCLIYDGAPDYPGPDRLWAMTERHQISTLGISPTLVRSLIQYGDGPVKSHDLSSIHVFASTGEPWNPDPWLWLFKVVGESKRPIVNYSGGTEISGGILSGNPLLPLKPCAFSDACPGIAADVLNENGKPVHNQVGELVIRTPWIGMTRSFWKDDERYLKTYWSRWKDVWVHGDWAAIDKDGLWYILGRSDDTINVGGKRLGPAEIESILVSHPCVSEAAVIGIPDKIKGSVLVGFCVLDTNYEPSDSLGAELRAKVATEMGKPLKPQRINFVSDLPKTRSAKVMRRMIRSAYLGEDPGDTSSLANPDAIHEIRKII